jgi:hypothetical protein
MGCLYCFANSMIMMQQLFIFIKPLYHTIITSLTMKMPQQAYTP